MEDVENFEKPEGFAKENHMKFVNKEENKKFVNKEDHKETKKREGFNSFDVISPEKQQIYKENVNDDNNSSVNESVNLEELENIKVFNYFFLILLMIFWFFRNNWMIWRQN